AGGLPVFDICGKVCPPRCAAQGTTERKAHEGLSTFTAHSMGVQISYRLYSQVSAQGVVYGATDGLGSSVSGPGPTERVSGGRRAFAAGSCPHVNAYSPQVCSGGHCGVCEGEECDSYCADVSGQGTQLHGGELLGARLFRVDRWCGRS